MADPIDVLTLAEAKGILSIVSSNTTKEAQLARVITTVSRRLDSCIGPTVARTVTSERHNGGRPELILRKRPVISIGAVTEYQSTVPYSLNEETLGVEPTEGWYSHPYEPQPELYSGIVVRRTAGFDTYWWPGRGNINFMYTAGRSTTTADVEPRIKEGAALMLRNWWHSYEQGTNQVAQFDVPMQNFPTFAIPKAVKELLHDLWQPEVGFGAPW